MKLKKSDINLLIMLAGVLIALASYLFVFKAFNEKRAVLEGDNAALQTEVDELQKLADNKQFYIDETTRMNEEIATTMGYFPPGILEEDIIMYTYNLENSQPIFFESISTDVPQLVTIASDAPTDAQQDAVVEEGTEVTEQTSDVQDAVTETPQLQDEVFLYATPVTYGFKSTYRSIKDLITEMLRGQDRMGLQSVTLSFDAETGCIQGSLAVNEYTMQGTGKYYELMDIQGVPTGVDDIFKSGTVLNINTGSGVFDESDEDTEEADSEASADDEEDKEVVEEN